MHARSARPRRASVTLDPVHRLDIVRSLQPDDHHAVLALVDDVTAVDRRRPLSDHLWLDLVHGARPGFAGLLLRDATDHLVGYAQVSRGNDTSTVEVVVHPDHRHSTESMLRTLVGAALEVVATDGGGSVAWWVTEPTGVHEQVAGEFGLTAGRRLLQMCRPLPTGATVQLSTRPFVPGADDEAWLEVNNRAFASHGEQGGWDLETLRRRQREDWFDAEGFLLHERDGRLAGFCWTKVHPETDPVVGEIYVIAVDPDFHGQGLGAQLTLAGLEFMASKGVGTGMLHVDADNTAAVTLYERLGFTTRRTDLAFVGEHPRKATPS
jgi:mycothiol synthase